MKTTLTLAAMVMVLGAAPTARAVECTDCHERVDVSKLGASAHGKLDGGGTASCKACHADIQATDEGHAEPARVDCARCHKPVGDKFASSIHGPKGGGNATCVDCHGSHEVQKATPAAHRERVGAMCAKCHDGEDAKWKASLHGHSDSQQAPTCVECHGVHDILPRSDPRSRTHRLNGASMCGDCHTNPEVKALSDEQRAEVKEYFNSTHGLAVTKGGLLVAATCVDCHGAHDMDSVKATDSHVLRKAIPSLCGKCHVGVLRVYMDSVHGKPFAEGNIDVPVCTDCHRSHQIKSPLDPMSSVYSTNVSPTCLRCHSNEQYVNKYSFPGLRGQTYAESYHGAASKLGDPKVANCSSCHGAHNIRKSEDPKSSTNAANMQATCGKCHKVEDPSRPMAFGKIHLTLAQENHWITGVLRNIYVVLIAGTLGFFGIYIVLDLYRLLSVRRRRR